MIPCERLHRNCCTVGNVLVMVADATGVLAAAGTAAASVGEPADSAARRRLGADGAKCPTAGAVVTLAATERAAVGPPEALLAAADGVGAALATDLVERMPPAARAALGALTLWADVVERPLPPTLGPAVVWLEDGEPPLDRSAWASPVPTVA
jgi:hypothetical protein